MANSLIVYSSTDGQTKKICLKLQEAVERQGEKISIVPIEDVGKVDLEAFDKIIIGASVRYGKHAPQIVQFIEKNRPLLESKPNAFFSVNVVARKAQKSKPEDNPYLQKFLKRLSWSPKELAVFAGKIDYPSYRFIDRSMIRLIMWMTKGPTDPKAIVEFTNWKQVDDFALLICEM